MTDEMTDCPDRGDRALALVNQLPTLQRNALRKIFDRPAFTPEEVARLGYRRLQQAEGIGRKGLEAITAWLGRHGFELKPPELPVEAPKLARGARRNIEQAVRLLRTHGYVVQVDRSLPPGGKSR